MALAFSNLDTNSQTNTTSGFTATTASVAVPNNNALFLFAVAAVNSGTVTITLPVMTGLTFTELTSAAYGSRRRGGVYVAINTSGSTVTNTIAIGVTPATADGKECMWSAVLASDVDTTTPNGTVATPTTSAGATSNSATVTGTPDSGDAVLAFFAHTGAASAMTLTGETDVSLVELGSGTDCRRIKVAYDLTPDSTPTASVSWTGAEDSFGVAFIVNAAAAGGTALEESEWLTLEPQTNPLTVSIW
jgi:hypothetical protein